MITKKHLESLELLVDEYDKAYDDLTNLETELTELTDKIAASSKVLIDIRKKEETKINEIAKELDISTKKVSEMILTYFAQKEK